MSVCALAERQKKDYNGIINRVRPCALSAASTGSCAADEGIDRGAGSASRCCMDLGAGESRLRFLPGSECCWNSRPPLCGLSQGRAFFASCLLFLFKEDNYDERQKNFGAYPDHAGPAGGHEHRVQPGAEHLHRLRPVQSGQSAGAAGGGGVWPRRRLCGGRSGRYHWRCAGGLRHQPADHAWARVPSV